MARILHISDIHLSSERDSQVLGDYKAKSLIPLSERRNRLDLLRNSLSALAASLGQEPLDAVVLSGDVSLGYDKEGFSELEETLSRLGPLLPDHDHIVVVPGNHDVRRGSEPSTRDRYELFIEFVRNAGYVTPLLEGIDLGSDLTRLTDHSPVLVTEDETIAIVAVNSTNHCQSPRHLPGDDPAWEHLKQAATAFDAKGKLAAALEDLKFEDIASVSDGQLSALAEEFNRLPSPIAGGPLRCVALHHHLLPVSTSEEFKAFESVTNLGQFRFALGANGVSLVLHGHKHTAASYIDQVTVGDLGTRQSQSYLVSAVASVWELDNLKTEFARLVKTERFSDRARLIRIDSLPFTASGGSAPTSKEVANWVPQLSPLEAPPVLEDKSVADVYGRITALFDGNYGLLMHGLICVVQDGQSAAQPPPNCPTPDGVDDLDKWVQELVDWWQAESPDLEGRARCFNHGQRIFKYRQKRNQISDVIEAIARSPRTTRGIALLIDPDIDHIRDPDRRMPSFVSLNFLPNEEKKQIDCVAYFRKQEMRLWWPINVCEIARLQEMVVRGVNAKLPDMRAGSITTVAGHTILGEGRPRVLVPLVDRLAQNRPEAIWEVAYDLLYSRAGEQETAYFFAFFEDWQPIGRVENDGTAISLTGLRTLAAAISSLSERMGITKGHDLAEQISDLHDINLDFANGEEDPQDTSEKLVKYRAWEAKVGGSRRRIAELVAEIAAEPQNGSTMTNDAAKAAARRHRRRRAAAKETPAKKAAAKKTPAKKAAATGISRSSSRR